MLDDIFFQVHPEPDQKQPKLFDDGGTAFATRAAAKADADKKHTARQLQFLIFLKEAGASGLIRHELASKAGCTLSGVCAPVLDLLRSQDIVEDGTRISPYGKKAAILKLPEFSGRQS